MHTGQYVINIERANDWREATEMFWGLGNLTRSYMNKYCTYVKLVELHS